MRTYLTKGNTMSANFDYIRKKRTAIAIVNTAVLAVACFAIVFGVFMLISKLGGIDLTLTVGLPISLGVGAAAGGLAAAFGFKSRMDIAKELDKAYSLDERIQTMIAFENDGGDIARLQREDTERLISRVGDNRSIFRHFGASLIAIVLAVAIMLPAVLVPHAESGEPTQDTPPPTAAEPFKLEKWQSDRLKKLIETVSAAEIDEAFKSATVAELTRLLGALEQTDTKDKMISEVTSSIVLVDAAAEVTATYKTVAVALFSAKPLTAEDGEILDGESYKEIKNLARYLIKLNAIDFGQDIKAIREYFKGDTVITDESAAEAPEADTKETAVKILTLSEKLTNFKAELERVLSDESIPEGDVIKAHLQSFAAKLGECAAIDNEDQRQSLLDIEFDAMSDNISTALTAQYANKKVRDEVINTLMLLFEIEKDMLPKLLGDTVPTLVDGSDGNDGGSEDGGASGGYGEGNELYGSNDTIYDPFGKDGAGHKLYGDVFDDYYKKIVDLLSDESLSEETRQAIAEYFKRLSDGSN